ncbi:hypothetical protein CQW23_15180 [Capsicum baccatum]|uniref:Uncharacterized protein n=1 Tax=Capsicum baccatum TaxID=33114 RepID=A0A2G2WLB7_CAPBA|nr:hypothetical protein CQW23_15180 [Capsicum baccatum]
MEKGSDGFVRADQIDLKNLDEHLERHLIRTRTMEKNKKPQVDSCINYNTSSKLSNHPTTPTINPNPSLYLFSSSALRQRYEWEIDPAKLIIKTVLARGTFGTFHHGVYDGQDIAIVSSDVLIF